MKTSDLRVSNDTNELSRHLKRSILQSSRFLVWQNLNHEKHFTYGKILSQVNSKDTLTVEFNLEKFEGFHPKMTVFLFCPETKILLKGKISVLKKEKLRVRIISKFYLKEQRLIKRINLLKKDLYASIKRIIEQKGTYKIERVQLKDISDSGFGFFITPNRAIFFQPDSKIVFNSIEHTGVDKPIEGVIKHVTPVTANYELNNKLLLVGVEFEYSYPNIDQLVQQAQLEGAK